MDGLREGTPHLKQSLGKTPNGFRIVSELELLRRIYGEEWKHWISEDKGEKLGLVLRLLFGLMDLTDSLTDD